MARKNTLLWTFVENEDASANFDTKSNPTCVLGLDNLCIQVICDATVNGTFKILASTDEVQPKFGQTVQNWQELDFGVATTLNGVTGALFNLNQNPFNFIAIEWVDISGTGNLTAKLSAKQVGG